MQPDDSQQLTPSAPAEQPQAVTPLSPPDPTSPQAPAAVEPPSPQAAPQPPTSTPPPQPAAEQPAPTAVPLPDTIAQIASLPHSESPDLREIYGTICSEIVKEQGRIIGSLSYEQASQIAGLQIDSATYACTITGEPLVVLETLVDKYRQFFGNAAVEVCREAAMHLKAHLPDEQIPELLRG